MEKEPTQWSRADLDKLTELAKTQTVKAIAEQLDKSYDAVRHKIRSLGMKTKCPWERPYPELLKITRYSDKWGVKRAASHFKLTDHVVKNIRQRYKRLQVEFAKTVPEEDLLKTRSFASYYAAQKGYSEHSEDFASYVSVKMLTSRTVNVRWAFIDYLREHCGDTRSEHGAKEMFGSSHYVELDTSSSGDPDDHHKDSIQIAAEDGRDKPNTNINEIATRLKLDQDERAIFLLHYKWGLRQQEIGELFDMSESRICQILTNIHSDVRERGKLQELI